MSWFRKAGEKYAETKRLYDEGKESKATCEHCDEVIPADEAECPYCDGGHTGDERAGPRSDEEPTTGGDGCDENAETEDAAVHADDGDADE